MRLFIVALLLFVAAPAFAQDTPTPTPTSTPTHTPTPTNTPTATFAAPPTPVCVGARLSGPIKHAVRTVANTTEVALIEASASDKSIVLQTLCASAAGATIVTLTYEQPYEATTIKMDFAAAGVQCVDVRGWCLPDGIDLALKQSQSVSTQVTATYNEQ